MSNTRKIFEGAPWTGFTSQDTALLRKSQTAQRAGLPTDDMGLPVGAGGMRRFATNAPGEGGGGPGSTSAVLLGQAGYQVWARDERERGKQVPAWDQGEPYRQESLTPEQVVDQLIEGEGEADEVSGEPRRSGGWQLQFPGWGVPPEIDDLVQKGELVDTSMKMEGTPSFALAGWQPPERWPGRAIDDTVARIFVQSLNSTEREHPDFGRYLVVIDDLVHLDTDDLAQALAALRANNTPPSQDSQRQSELP